ncbi:MAG: tetratricopeptide repeat protein [Desulfobacterales bacterium]|nr:tetratricopeptide repeat protein [Desulfobacterales bacterium]
MASYTETNGSGSFQLKLRIKEDGGRYAVEYSASGREQETYFIGTDEIKKISDYCGLADSFITHHDSRRFMNDFIGIGTALHRLFLEPFTGLEAFTSDAVSQNSPVLINIQTHDHEINRLPWEFLYSPENQFIAASPRFQVIRTVGDDGFSAGDLSPGPLRILFMACSPDGVAPLLNYEREEEIILNAVAELKQEKGLEIEIAEGGTLEELTSLLAKKAYHAVHLSGHGYYDEINNSGYLCMENESGTEKRVSATDLANALIGCKSVRLLFLGACHSADEKAKNTGLAHLLISNGIPTVIGMKHAVGDHAAAAIAESFYRHLTLKRSVFHAFQLARRDYAEKNRASLQWAIPAVFSRHGSSAVVDWEKPLEPVRDKPPNAVLYGKVKHLKTGFRGRRREFREFLKMLRQANPSAICITGAGGIGKSTLASRVADRLHKSGYMIIPMYGEITPDMFIQKTLNALVSAKEDEHREYLKSLTDYEEKIVYILSNILGTKQTLYLLDNFEDNLSKSSEFREFKNPFWEQTFRNLAEHLPDTCSKMLITCRYAIPGISESLMFQRSLKEMSEAEARKLMIFSRDFAGISVKQVKEVYGTIGGNPKAVEDLGKLLSKGDMSWEFLKEKLEAVKKDMREFTLFETLYNFLSEKEQGFFRRASVFQGPVEIEGLKLMESDDAELERFIDKLIDYSLLQAYEDNIFETVLYQVHPLNRGHVRDEWWNEGEKEKAHCDAAGYYLEKGQGFDIDGLLKAVYHLREGKKYDEMAKLITAYEKQTRLSGFWDESIYLHNIILEEKSIEKKFYGIAYNNIGMIYDNKGDWEKALEFYLKSEKIKIEIGNKADMGPTYSNIGGIYDKKGDWERALEFYLKAEEIMIEAGNKAGLGMIYNSIGLIYSKKGDWERAMEFHLKSEKINLEAGNEELAPTYNNIGAIYYRKGDWERALEFYLKSEKISFEVGDKAGLGTIYNNIGAICHKKGDWDRALKFYLKSEKIRVEVGDKAMVGITYNNIGGIYSKKGDWDRALEFYLKAKKIMNEVGDKSGLGTTYNNMGLIYSNKGDWGKALEFYLKAKKIRIEVGDKAGLAYTYFNIGTIFLQKNDKEKANNNLILAGYIAISLDMKHALSEFEWALAPVLEEVGKEKFVEIGKRLYDERFGLSGSGGSPVSSV